MPRTPLPIGTWGEISTRTMKTTKKGKPVMHLAHARFRDQDGRVRAVTATGTTKTAARTALLTKLQNRAETNHSGELRDDPGHASGLGIFMPAGHLLFDAFSRTSLSPTACADVISS